MEPNFKFNLGALLLTPIFGFATKSWICLLAIFPPATLIVGVIAGFCGPKWAYESGSFSTVEEFNAVMNTWHRAGKFALITYIATIVFALLCMLMAIAGLFALKDSYSTGLIDYAQELVRYPTIL